ncbi:GyrI-like domain-containing protein [Sanguibacter antarcticus]|uniref:GyrI-like small molecule binding domain-containing protein n=1 Tax=Sanguibacter antarcticus TaxID=372484 RepID=A0A2A9E8P4_9MICO|nr:GyrI-like domain-containing protein [Sanguibacter antarcticus]PFG34921.1 hypothetical protein ATL42_2852 [Sanguibacter antarcticus]
MTVIDDVGTTAAKYDIKRDLKAVYSAPTTDFVRVCVPPIQYLAVDGAGDPNTAPAYAEAIETLFGLSYAVKFASKTTLGRDYVVGPLEALWRSGDLGAFVSRDKGAWEWTAMIAQPAWITAELVDTVHARLAATKDLPASERVRLVVLDEGDSLQILHIGSYDDEAPTLHRLHEEHMPANSLTFAGDHHEVYLSDARRTAPARLRTILRQPVAPL